MRFDIIVIISRLRLLFSMSAEAAEFNECVLIKLLMIVDFRLRFSSSDQAEEIVEEITTKGKEAMAKAMCVSIKHIMAIISRLRGSPLARRRQESLSAS